MLPETSQLLVFVSAALLLLATPGPAVLFVVARSAEQGRLAGLASVAGLVAGGAVHVLGAALGISGLLMSSATLYTSVKIAGAAYLIYLGLRTWFGAKTSAAIERPEPHSYRRLMREGFIVNVLNPKAALFFLAFLPQFTDASRGSVGSQILALGGLFLALAWITDSAYALAAGSLVGWFQERPRRLAAQRWISGAIYVGLGAATAIGSRSR